MKYKPTSLEEELIALIKKYEGVCDTTAEGDNEGTDRTLLCSVGQVLTLHILGFGLIMHQAVHQESESILTKSSFLASALGITPEGFEERSRFLASTFPEDFKIMKEGDERGGESLHDVLKAAGIFLPNHGDGGQDEGQDKN